MGIGVDGEQSLAKDVHLGLTDGQGGGHELSVDIAGADGVEVDDGEMLYAGSHEAFSAPRPYASYAEEYDADGGETLHRLVAEEQFRAVEYG